MNREARCDRCGSVFRRGMRKRYCSETCSRKASGARQKAKRDKGIREGFLYGRPIQDVIFDRYRDGAEKRGLLFTLDREAFLALWGKPCTYCGAEIPTIGVDRMDSARGYEEGNVVSCCTRCNLSKRNMLPEEYVAHSRRVAEHANATGRRANGA